MANARKITVYIPELDRAENSGAPITGKCRLILETDKAYRGGVDSTVRVEWIDGKGFATCRLGLGGGGDYSKTYALIPGAATQKRIDTLHAETFGTEDKVLAICNDVKRYYFAETAKYAAKAIEQFSQQNQPKQGICVTQDELAAEREALTTPETEILNALPKTEFDYTNQAWLVDGKYKSCAHPAEMNCNCFGRIHAGEPAAADAEIYA